ncbi:MAG: NAD(P)-dependent oxidoreductase [Gammaproteobacteria bacterium]|nr:NAD(P)-dependent oxidoreductase [Gammaproteobacteria bacterium]
MANKKIVVTGACGYVAQRMWRELHERYDVVALDVHTATGEGVDVPGVQVCDLTDPNRDAYREYFAGADAVVHCAFVSAVGLDATTFLDNSEAKFRAEHANVGMAYNVYQTALEENVGRVVVASSNHAADFYERLIWADKWDCVTPDMLPLSDNFYGWAKAAYELLGFVFATGQIGGRKLEVVQLRIGGPRDNADLDALQPGEVKKMHRGLGAYLSRRDQVQLFIKSIETADISDANGIPFQVFYGVSGNTHNFWSIVNARDVIGYAPEDNSQVNFAERIAEIAKPR